MNFGGLFGYSWKEYKDNFKPIFKLNFYFAFLPITLLIFIGVILFFSLGIPGDLQTIQHSIECNYTGTGNGEYGESVQVIGLENTHILGKIFVLFVPFYILFIVLFFLSFLAYIGNFAASFKKNKFSFKEALEAAKKNYWSFIGLMIIIYLILLAITFVLMLIIILLSILFTVVLHSLLAAFILAILVILAFFTLMYFFVKLSIAPYSLVDQRRGVGEALNSSWRLTKNNWWRIFGYCLFFLLVMAVLWAILYLIEIVVLLGAGIGLVGGGEVSQLSGMIFLIFVIFWIIYQVILDFVIIPVSLLFFKNVYLDLKKGKR